MHHAKRHLPVLDGLRCLAILFVIVGHVAQWIVRTDPMLPFDAYAERFTYLGMCLFFVLSGFVIHLNYASIASGERKKLWNFFVARFSRLYPLYAVLLLLEFIPLADHLNMGMALYYLSMTQSWFYLMHNGKSLIDQFSVPVGISWSISTEIFFYIAYAMLAFPLVRMLSTIKRNLYVMLAVYVFIAAFYGSIGWHYESIDRWAMISFGPEASMTPHASESFLRWILYYSPYSRIGEFILGALAANIYMLKKESVLKAHEAAKVKILIPLLLIVVATIQGLGTTYLSLDNGIFLSAFYAPFVTGIIYFVARFPYHHFSRMLSWKILVYGGYLSYSLYLLHAGFLLSLAPPAKLGVDASAVIELSARVVMAVLPLVALSWVVYRWFERPVQQFIRRKLAYSNPQY